MKRKPEKPRNSKLKKILLIIGISILGLVLLGYIYETIFAYIDTKTITPPGKMIEIDGHNMHLYCTGEYQEGKPTVILEAGGGQNYTTWTKIQPEISKYTKVCSYDRIGLGFSYSVKNSYTNTEIVTKLETLLRKGEIRGPYIMVGHSMGGFYARLFTKRNINEVKGLLLVDSSVDEQVDYGKNHPTESIPLAPIMFIARIGIPRLAMTIAPHAFGLDEGNEKIERALYSTMYKDKDDGTGFYKDVDLVYGASHFGNLPVIILRADKSLATAFSSFGDEVKGWDNNLKNNISDNSKLITVKDSNHFIQDDQPQVVIDNILELLK